MLAEGCSVGLPCSQILNLDNLRLTGTFPAPIFVAFNNLGPGDTFQPFGYFLFDRFGGNPDSDLSLAFTPSTDFTLETLELALSMPGNVGLPADVDVWLMEDIGGRPGLVIESFRHRFAAPTAPSVIRFASLLRPHLQGNVRYWVVASVTTPDPNGTVVWWHFSPTGGAAFRVVGVRE